MKHMQFAMLKRLLFPLLAISAAIILSYLIDDNLGWAWPTNVIRNWQQFGFLKLHGQLVLNAGGFEATKHPDIYGGMSPVCLYPVYFVTQIFRWTGLDTLAFHILLAAVVFWGSWRLMGRDHFALLASAVAILCPGYLRWPKALDPNALSVLPVIPYAALILIILKRPKLSPALTIALIVLTLAFMSLNWTTAWVCGPCIFLLLATPGLNRRGLVTIVGVMVIAVPLVVLGSFAAKFGHKVPATSATTAAAPATSGDPLSIIAGYTWGSGGYSDGQSSGRIFLRLAFTNIVGLLPLWFLFLYALVHHVRSRKNLSWLVFAPVALTLMDLVVMRNYFGHHPWMAGPVLVIGVIFSLAALRVSRNVAEEPERLPFKAVCGAALLCFIYGFAVLLFFRANETDLLALLKLVRQHTARSDTIILLTSDSSTAPLADRLIEPLDRRIIVLDDIKSAASENHPVILSSVPLDDSLSLIAQSTTDTNSFLTRVGNWFNHSISRRRAGDRLELPDHLYLYGTAR